MYKGYIGCQSNRTTMNIYKGAPENKMLVITDPGLLTSQTRRLKDRTSLGATHHCWELVEFEPWLIELDFGGMKHVLNFGGIRLHVVNFEYFLK